LPERAPVATPSSMASKEDLYDEGLDLAFDEDYRGALAKYREALEIDPAYTDALHALAMAHAELGELDEAVEAGKRLCEIAPDDILAHTSLSTFYMNNDMIPEAEAESAKARMLDWKRQLKEGGDS
jgi:tetratricopeptide (TPR) repeat protein